MMTTIILPFVWPRWWCRRCKRGTGGCNPSFAQPAPMHGDGVLVIVIGLVMVWWWQFLMGICDWWLVWWLALKVILDRRWWWRWLVIGGDDLFNFGLSLQPGLVILPVEAATLKRTKFQKYQTESIKISFVQKRNQSKNGINKSKKVHKMYGKVKLLPPEGHF